MKKALFLLILLTALAVRTADALPYEGYEQDRALLRDTSHLPKPPLNASSAKACEAAGRLFNKVTFVGLSRERVLAILGDPKTISDYGVAAATEPDSPLTYRFDSGFGGWNYVIEFRAGVVSNVRKESLD
jgi:hypothetical protein